jgi:hypothetical protein
MHVSTHSEGGNEREGVRGEQGELAIWPLVLSHWLPEIVVVGATRNKQPMATNVFNMFLKN